jgi:hypothetical protein
MEIQMITAEDRGERGLLLTGKSFKDWSALCILIL